MKFLFDLFPVFVFFGVYSLAERVPEAAVSLTTNLLAAIGLDTHFEPSQGPILLATAAAIIASIGQVLYLMARRRPVDKMLWISLVIIVVMGGLTLALHDSTFIKWKPTVLYWVFGAVLLGSDLLLGRNLIRKMMEGQLTLPDPIWRRVNLSWVGFFVLMGVLNLYVAFNFSESAWVKFKLFGGMGLMFVFALGQGLLLQRYAEDDQGK